jgi:hypothetical protein
MNSNNYYEDCYQIGVQKINEDKPHRCPGCHTVAFWLDIPSLRFTSTHLIVCYKCDTTFTRWPLLTRLWSLLGRIYAEPVADDAGGYLI